MSRPTPHSCRPCVPRGLWVVRATLVQRAQPTLCSTKRLLERLPHRHSGPGRAGPMHGGAGGAGDPGDTGPGFMGRPKPLLPWTSVSCRGKSGAGGCPQRMFSQLPSSPPAACDSSKEAPNTPGESACRWQESTQALSGHEVVFYRNREMASSSETMLSKHLTLYTKASCGL